MVGEQVTRRLFSWAIRDSFSEVVRFKQDITDKEEPILRRKIRRTSIADKGNSYCQGPKQERVSCAAQTKKRHMCLEHHGQGDKAGRRWGWSGGPWQITKATFSNNVKSVRSLIAHVCAHTHSHISSKTVSSIGITAGMYDSFEGNNIHLDQV